jgi:hypothetical protein
VLVVVELTFTLPPLDPPPKNPPKNPPPNPPNPPLPPITVTPPPPPLTGGAGGRGTGASAIWYTGGHVLSGRGCGATA